VGDDYFAAMGLELERGRVLGPGERADSPTAMVINRLAAERFFPGVDPVGHRARALGSSWDTGEAEIVGVVETVRNRGPGTAAEPEVFTHHRQSGGRYNQLFLVVRAATDPYALVPAIRETVARLDPQQPVYAIGTATEALSSQTAPRRVAAATLSGFSLAALVLAALGVYGVVGYSVATRGRELALRRALGATDRDLVRMIVGETLATVGAGLALGLAGAWALTRALGSSFEVLTALEPLQTLAPALLLAVTALVAGLVPARRATHTHPARALREE
jgi:putative ABC transport system permease protein